MHAKYAVVWSFSIVIILVIAVASRAACPPSPTTYANGAIEGPATSDGSRNATVAVDGNNRFAMGWESLFVSGRNTIYVARFNANGTCLCNSGDSCPAAVTDPGTAAHHHPSVAIQQGSSPTFRLIWEGSRTPNTLQNGGGKLYALNYSLLASPFGPPPFGAPTVGSPVFYTPSAGVSDVSVCADGWARARATEFQSDTQGLGYDNDCPASTLTFVQTCGDTGVPQYCYTATWLRCNAKRVREEFAGWM